MNSTQKEMRLVPRLSICGLVENLESLPEIKPSILQKARDALVELPYKAGLTNYYGPGTSPFYFEHSAVTGTTRIDGLSARWVLERGAFSSDKEPVTELSIRVVGELSRLMRIEQRLAQKLQKNRFGGPAYVTYSVCDRDFALSYRGAGSRPEYYREIKDPSQELSEEVL